MAGAKQKPATKLRSNKPYGKSQASNILKVSRPTIDRMIKDGRLKTIEIGGRNLVQKPEKKK